LGIKPVYYYAGDDFFVFGSEIKSILQHPGVPREVDRDALDIYMALRYVPGPRTMFKNIFKLQPGHWLTVDERGTRIGKYWDIQYPSEESAPQDHVERFREAAGGERQAEVDRGSSSWRFSQRRSGLDCGAGDDEQNYRRPASEDVQCGIRGERPWSVGDRSR
jgi:hypothetical protein